MTSLKRIGINMISGGAGYIIPMVINIFSTPYVLTTIGEEAYGLQALAGIVIGYLVVADMGLDIPITRKIAEYYALNDLKNKSKFLSATIKLYFIIGIAGMILILISTEKLINLFSIPITMRDQAQAVFYLASIGFLGSLLTMWGKAVFNGLHRYDISNGVSVLNNLFGIVLGIFLLMNGYGVVGFFAARILGFLLMTLVYLIAASKYMSDFKLFPIIDLGVWQYLKTQIGFGILLRLSGLIFSKMDQALISAWIGIAVVGIYSVPLLIATALSGLIASITHFAFPLASSMNVSQSVKEVESVFSKLSKLIVTIATLIFIPFIALGSNFLSLWISPSIGEQSQYVFILLLISSYLNSCLTIALNSFIVGTGHLKFFTVYSICRSLVLLFGFIAFIKLYGMDGAGLAFLISLIADLVYFFLSIRKKLNFKIMELLKTSYLKPIIPGLIPLSLFMWVGPIVNTWLKLTTAVALFGVIYFLVAWAIGLFDKSEKEIFISMVRKLNKEILHRE